MRRVVCLNAISPKGLELLPEGYEVSEKEVDADAILVRSASMHDMKFSKSLRCIARAGAGVNNIPLERCAEEGIVVFNTPGANANAVKEMVIAGILLAARDIPGGMQWCLENKEDPTIGKDMEKAKKAFAGHEIIGKKLGVICPGHGSLRLRSLYLRQFRMEPGERCKAHQYRGYHLQGVRLYHRTCAGYGFHKGHD